MTAELRTIATTIFHQTLAAIEVTSVVQRALQREGKTLRVAGTEYNLEDFTRVLVIAVGKASVPMARAAESILGSYLTDGLVATNALAGEAPKRLPLFIGGHPLPNQDSLRAAETALQLLAAANDEKTLVLFLLSGGGSALFEKPLDPTVTLDDLQTINRILVGCGAIISEINTVRRFLSAVKGGRLAQAAPRAHQISLYISDVNQDDLSTVSSGLTLPSQTTQADLDKIVGKYQLLAKFPPHIVALFRQDRIVPEPAQPPMPTRAHHLLLDNQGALLQARQIAENLYGCAVEIADDLIEGEIEEMVQTHLIRLRALQARHPGKIVCLLSGGEVICPVRGPGQGGRNQEFVLRAALRINAYEPLTVLSAGTDGIDGQSPAAGALADETTMERAREQKLVPQDFCSVVIRFIFEPLGDTLLTGPTGNNVRDLRILLAQKST